MAAHWESDGSPEIIIDGSTVECRLDTDSQASGNVFNALWKEDDDGVTAGTHYWKVQVAQNSESIFVGLTDRDKFQKGWGCKGLLYGGNLSNGGALLVSNYGPPIKAGNTIGILAVFEAGKLRIYFDQDGVPLGLAFDLAGNVLGGAFPVVHFSGPGRVSIVKSDDIPTNLTRPEPVYEGIEGNWKCTLLNEASPAKSATIGISRKSDDRNSYGVHMRVVNSINFTIRYDTATNAWTLSGGIRSTRMGSTPELMALERQMSRLVSVPSSLEVVGEFLQVSSADGTTSKWERYSTATQPVTENPFN